MEKLSETTSSFANAGYGLVPKLANGPVCSFLYEYVVKSARAGRFNLNDDAVPNTPGSYADPFMDALLELSLPRMEAESGLRLFPTYSYFRVYKCGDVLKRHQDRPSCEVSATLNLGYKAQKPWPIWIEVDGMAKSISLEPGRCHALQGNRSSALEGAVPGRKLRTGVPALC